MSAARAATQIHDADCFDPSVIESLLGIMSADAVSALLLDMERDVRDRLVRLAEVHVASGSLAMIAQDAHDLKSMGGNFGLVELAHHAGIIERAARDGSLDTVRASLPALILSGQRSINALNDHHQLRNARAS